MSRAVAATLAVVGLLAIESRPAQAQFVAGPVGGFGYGYQSGFSFNFSTPHGRIGGSFGSSFGVAMPLPGWGAAGAWGTGPGWGWGWPEPLLVAEPPLIFIPPPIVIAGGFPIRREAGVHGGFDITEPKAGLVPDDGAKARVDAAVVRGALIPIRPGKEPPAREVGPTPGVIPGGKPPIVALPKDPKDLALVRVVAARTAFSEEQYGRAADHLLAAAKLSPVDPLPHFLLAQVQTARGEYAEAVAAIRDGMKKAPDWPASRFRLKELYEKNDARFETHLADLRAAANKNPDDPALAFLLGYHLWFLGEREAAIKLFRHASPRVKDNSPIERFLREALGKDT